MGRTLGMNRARIVEEPWGNELLPLLAIAVDPGKPFAPRSRRLLSGIAGVELGQKLAKERPHVRHQPERDRVVAPDLLRVDVDVNELGRRDGERVSGNP